MAKLVDVYHPSKALNRRQVPLVIDETLTMVMDLKSLGLLSDNQQVKGKELEDFVRKMSILNDEEICNALQVSRSELLKVLNEAVPCVGCRRSVERLYYQLCKYGHPTLDPIVIKKDGIITVREDKQNSAQFLCNLFHRHSTRLNHVVDSQPRRNKKSHRCLLHSLDSQRSRPVTPVWREVWDCMRLDCKKKVCTIEETSLHSTLETYLRKHRFCSECRTKVLKAYSLLLEDPKCNDKGYVKTLYSGITHCKSHIHLNPETEVIPKLISRAEPDLQGNRRERHAKTLEIAQEEVLTCIGICMYERLHRIYMRMREEECTCQVFAVVAVDALWRNFETAVEHKQGITQLELLYAELTRKEQQKQLRKEQKKLKRKRKKEKQMGQQYKTCNDCDCEELEEPSSPLHKLCTCSLEKVDKSNESLDCKACLSASELKVKVNLKEPKEKSSCTGPWVDECKCHNVSTKNGKGDYFLSHKFCKKESSSCSDHSHDCGYSSENNIGCCEFNSFSSSLPSSPEGSEVACPDGCCESENEYIPYNRFSYGSGHQLSLQEMLDVHFYCGNASDCYITPEEVQEFKINNSKVYEMRQQLRETLQRRFVQLCLNGPLQVPRLLVPTKFVAN